MTYCWEGINQMSFLMGDLGDTDDARLLEDHPSEMGFTCLLQAEHTGSHEWTPDSQIMITFAPAPSHAHHDASQESTP